MYESDFQKRISKTIIGKGASSLSVGLTENGNAVIVKVGDHDAAYTADEARELATSLKTTSDQRWDESADAAVQYIRDMADVADGVKEADEIEDCWQEKELNP